MTVAFVAAGALAGTVTLPQLDIVAPACSVDDILIAAIHAKDNQVWTAPAGWTKFVEVNNTVAQRCTLAWKRVVAGDSGATFSFTVPTDNNITYHGMISAWSGCISTGTPIDSATPTTSANALSDNVTYASFNPARVVAYVVAIGLYSDDLTTAGAITGTDPTLTNRWDLEDATGLDASIFGYSGTSSSIATGARSNTTTSMVDAISVGVLFGLVSAIAVITGTIVPTVTEANIVTGGKTLIITLTNDTWIAAGAASFDLQRDEIIAGVDSAQSEALGWDSVPKTLQSLANVVRTSNTVVTITWDAFATYNITANEKITVTVPSTAVLGAQAILATPTFAVTFISTQAPRSMHQYRKRRAA